MLVDFFESPQALRVSQGPSLRRLLVILESEPVVLFDITFYAKFAAKAFEVMQREGKDAEGFARMQQSFRDTVEKVRTIISLAKTKGFSEASQYTSIDAESFQKLIGLIRDLALVKDWMLYAEGEGRSLHLSTETGSDT